MSLQRSGITFTNKKPLIIAEVKTQSPFGFKSEKTWDELFALANSIGDIISIHTDTRWGGSFELVSKARRLTAKPILAKGIHATDVEIEHAFRAGADFVLVVGRVPKNLPEEQLEKCLIEPLTLSELALIPQTLKAVWNSRDLANGAQKIETFEQARAAFKGWLCQASNIKTIADMKKGADAILVGENLEKFAESLGASLS